MIPYVYLCVQPNTALSVYLLYLRRLRLVSYRALEVTVKVTAKSSK